HPHVVWEWYEYRRGLVREVEPNPGHYELARWEKHFSDFTLITQNVDGLHRRAGSSEPIELHGNIMLTRCHDCGEYADVQPPGENDDIPRCHCGGFYRPAVVWFGEMLPREALENAWAASARADVYLSVGTSSLVQPAASLIQIARQNGAYLIEVNPEPTGASYMCDAVLRHPSGIALPALGRRIGVPDTAA
ncbi:MAG: NAD-dependent protein deacylase, partial [candidate division Zixibacteria bacterium]|nr:NAD-dependent protein deacylase [candidate division Zixibacteria bacterium]